MYDLLLMDAIYSSDSNCRLLELLQVCCTCWSVQILDAVRFAHKQDVSAAMHGRLANSCTSGPGISYLQLPEWTFNLMIVFMGIIGLLSMTVDLVFFDPLPLLSGMCGCTRWSRAMAAASSPQPTDFISFWVPSPKTLAVGPHRSL